MAAAEDAVDTAIQAYRASVESERARLEAGIKTAIIAMAPFSVDIKAFTATATYDPQLPVAGDRLAVTVERITVRGPQFAQQLADQLRK